MPVHSPLALAALACSAVPGLEPVSATELPTGAEDVDGALVGDDLGRSWVVRAPRTAAAGVRLEQESILLDKLTSWLPFTLPDIAGTSALRGGGRAVVTRPLAGEPLQPGDLVASDDLARAVGQAIAAIHELPTRLIEEIGLPVYGPEEYRFRRLAEVDRAAGTGLVPAQVLSRWEQGVENISLWRFTATVVHGDLTYDTVLADDDGVTGLLQWSESRVADPADDFAWIQQGPDADALPVVLEAYAQARSAPVDPHLAQRAELAGELGVARWLLHGVTTKDPDVIADALAMLDDLAPVPEFE